MIGFMGLEDRLYPLLRIYEASPQSVKTLVGSAYRRVPASLRLGHAYRKFRDEAEASETWSADEVAEYQFRELRKTLENAAENCRFYRDRFSERGFDVTKFNAPEDLAKLPMVAKSDVIEHRDAMASSAISKSGRLYVTTGGSTGVPVGFYLEKGVSRPKEQVYLEAMWRRAGFFDGARLAVVRGQVTGGRSGKKISYYDATRDWLILSSYQLTEERMPEYVEQLSRFRPDILHMYPSSALQMAEYLEASGEGLDFEPKALLCGSERLTLSQKERLERVFGTRVYRWYGHSERVVLAGEGRADERFLFWPGYGYVEFGEPDADGLREVIGTSFHNRAMPLIRYRTGDFVRLAEDEAGDREFAWPAAVEIAGREAEFLVSEDGRKVSLTAMNMHDGIFDGLYAVQFFQGEAGKVELRYEAGPRFEPDRLEQIGKGVMRKLGDGFALRMRAVEAVEKTAAGKHRWLVSEIGKRAAEIAAPVRKRILVVFNDYLEPGGERVAAEQIGVLLGRDHDVEWLTFHSSDWKKEGAPPAWKQALLMLHNPGSARELRERCATFQPDFLLVHNIHPVGSCSVLREARKVGIPVVKYIHNFLPYSISGWPDGPSGYAEPVADAAARNRVGRLPGIPFEDGVVCHCAHGFAKAWMVRWGDEVGGDLGFHAGCVSRGRNRWRGCADGAARVGGAERYRAGVCGERLLPFSRAPDFGEGGYDFVRRVEAGGGGTR